MRYNNRRKTGRLRYINQMHDMCHNKHWIYKLSLQSSYLSKKHHPCKALTHRQTFKVENQKVELINQKKVPHKLIPIM
jgi:hypothetical protein